MQQHAHPAAPVVATDDDEVKPETAADSPRPKKRSKKNEAGVGGSSRPGPSKPRGKACAECKRMKLRCDREFPCQTCIKRGLEGICPEGSLVTGRGTRYVLANTETLHEKIERMSERIRDLEEALRLFHAEHPLLQEELLRVKGQYELYGMDSPTAARDSQPDDKGAGGSHLRKTQVSTPTDSMEFSPAPEGFDVEMAPGPSSTSRHLASEDIRKPERRESRRSTPRPPESHMQMAARLRELLPDRLEAECLYSAACTNAAWIMNLRLSTSCLLRDLHAVYDAPPSADLPRDIALFLIVLAIGARANIISRERRRTREDVWRKGSSTSSISRSASDYYYQCRGVLSEVPFETEPDVRAVKCMLLIAWYHASLSDSKEAGRQATLSMGIAANLALKLKLNLEETYQNLPLEEQQELRILFWGLLHGETRINLGTNKLPSLSLVNITCKRLTNVLHSGIPSFQTPLEAVFHDFKVGFVEKCYVPILRMLAKLHDHGIEAVEYTEVLKLDSFVRDFPVPPALDQPVISNDPENKEVPSHVLSLLRSRIAQETQLALLQLHRLYWIAHVRDESPIVQRSYLPSAFATFGSACTLIKCVHDIWKREPELSACVSAFFYNAFTGAMSLGFLAKLKPSCPVTPLALEELESAVQLFRSASTKNYMAARVYKILRNFATDVQDVYDRWREQSEDDIQVFGPNGEIYLCYARLDVILDRLQAPSPFNSSEKAFVDRMKTELRVPQRAKEEIRQSYSTSELRASAIPEHIRDVPGDPASYDIWLHVHPNITEVVRRMPEALKQAKVDPRRAIASILLWDFIPLEPDEPKPKVPRAERDGSQRLSTAPSRQGTSSRQHGMDWSKVVNALVPNITSSPGSVGSTCRALPTPPSSETPPSVEIALESQTFFPIIDTCVALGCVNVDLDAPKTPVDQTYGFKRSYPYK